MIDTSCCVKTQEEIDEILREAARIYICYSQKEALEKMKQSASED